MIQQLPITVKRSIELMGLVALAFIIMQLQNIIMPMAMALVASIALLPLYRFLVRKKIPSSISIFFTMFLMISVSSLILIFIFIQLKPIIYDFATIKQNILNHINLIGNWVRSKTAISVAQQTELITQQTNNFLDSASSYINNAMSSLSTVVIFFGLFPIYTFFILYYRKVLREFVMMWFQKSDINQVEETIRRIESIIHSYIIGLMIQFTYMTILLGGILKLFDINYAFLIAVVFATLNLIPYIGALIGNIIGVLLTLSSSPYFSSVLTVLIIITAVQLLDNYILMPSIVGSKVKINALVSLFGVFVGGALAGIGGMFLSLPIMAVLKIVFDHTEQFKKWGVLFGDSTFKTTRDLANDKPF